MNAAFMPAIGGAFGSSGGSGIPSDAIVVKADSTGADSKGRSGYSWMITGGTLFGAGTTYQAPTDAEVVALLGADSTFYTAGAPNTLTLAQFTAACNGPLVWANPDRPEKGITILNDRDAAIVRQFRLDELPTNGLIWKADIADGLVDSVGLLITRKDTSIYDIGTVYYAAKVFGTWRYRAGGWPGSGDSAGITNNIQGCHQSAGAGNTVVVAAGDYYPIDIGVSGKLSYQHRGVIRQPSPSDPEYETYGGNVNFHGDSTVNDLVSFSGVTKSYSVLCINGLYNAPSGRSAIGLAGTGVGTELTGVIIDVAEIDSNEVLVSFGNYAGTASSPITFKTTNFKNGGANGSLGQLNFQGTGNCAVFDFCILCGSANISTTAGAVYFTGKTMQRIDFNNCSFIGNKGNVFYSPSSAAIRTITINNCIGYGNGGGLRSSKFYKDDSSGNMAITENNSCILPNAITPYKHTQPSMQTNPIIFWPNFVSQRRGGVVTIIIDDLYSLDNFYTLLLPELNSRSIIGGIAIDVRTASTSDYTKLAEIINNGHEVALHSDSHARLTDYNCINIRYVGSGSSCSMTISDNVLTVTVVGATGEDINIDLTDEAYGRVGYLQSYIDSLPPYTCSFSGTNNHYTKSTGLADVVGQDIKTAVYNALLDEDRYHNNEIVVAKSTLEYGVRGNAPPGTAAKSYTCKGFVHPEDYNNAHSRDTVYAAGMCGRSDYASGGMDIHNLDTTHIMSYSLETQIGLKPTLSDIQIKRNTLAMVSGLNYSGRIAQFYTHLSAAEDQTDRINTLKVVFDALIESGVSIKKFGRAVEEIKELASHNNGSIYYRCPTEDDSCLIDSSNYHLQQASSCIAAGVSPYSHSSGDQYDADGYQVWSDTTNLPNGHWLDGVDVGPYAHGGANKYYLSLLGTSGAYYWPSAPAIIERTGVDNAVFNADGAGKTFVTQALALAAMETLSDDTYLFAGTKAAVLYSVDMSHRAALINRYVGA